MFNVSDDIKNAKELIDSKEREPVTFNDKSPIYTSTNEMMSDLIYTGFLRNNKDVLTIIGSGDQVLNTILFDSINIDAVDICSFAKYYLEFKKAAVCSLTYEEYLDFFYGNRTFNNSLYKNIINHIENEEVKEFWNSLCSTKSLFSSKLSPHGLYKSNLFYSSRMKKQDAINMNPYLKKDNYYALKRKLHNNITVNYLTGDIMKLQCIGEKKYNLVNLSNIWMYGANMNGFGNECKYKDFITNLKLHKDGIVLSYLMRYIPNSYSAKFYDAYFEKDDRFDLHKIKSDSNCNDALLIYKKP